MTLAVGLRPLEAHEPVSSAVPAERVRGGVPGVAGHHGIDAEVEPAEPAVCVAPPTRCREDPLAVVRLGLSQVLVVAQGDIQADVPAALGRPRALQTEYPQHHLNRGPRR